MFNVKTSAKTDCDQKIEENAKTKEDDIEMDSDSNLENEKGLISQGQYRIGGTEDERRLFEERVQNGHEIGG